MGQKATIIKHLESDELKAIMQEMKESCRIYKRLKLITIVSEGNSIAKASKSLNISRKTGERWVKQYNEKGLEGLYPNYSNGGRKPKLPNEKLGELKEKITSEGKLYTIKEVQQLIKEEYDVDYDYKSVWRIVRKKLNLNYGKPFIKYKERPKDAEKDLKKN